MGCVVSALRGFTAASTSNTTTTTAAAAAPPPPAGPAAGPATATAAATATATSTPVSSSLSSGSGPIELPDWEQRRERRPGGQSVIASMGTTVSDAVNRIFRRGSGGGGNQPGSAGGSPDVWYFTSTNGSNAVRLELEVEETPPRVVRPRKVGPAYWLWRTKWEGGSAMPAPAPAQVTLLQRAIQYYN